jgi:acetyl esterase/lipase
LGIRLPIIVAGDDPGGDLRAVLAQRATRAGAVRSRCKVLVCPVKICDFETISYTDPETAYADEGRHDLVLGPLCPSGDRPSTSRCVTASDYRSRRPAPALALTPQSTRAAR